MEKVLDIGHNTILSILKAFRYIRKADYLIRFFDIGQNFDFIGHCRRDIGHSSTFIGHNSEDIGHSPLFIGHYTIFGHIKSPPVHPEGRLSN
ncbi:hypothetical protein [Ferdinandcohnia sp. SAFN-114]|uniref:hypothetical protein n=1 Tax=Ferdinandcohnia sp. SAFN-114 TaxID=3387275 RepID=UPI003F7F13B3